MTEEVDKLEENIINRNRHFLKGESFFKRVAWRLIDKQTCRKRLQCSSLYSIPGIYVSPEREYFSRVINIWHWEANSTSLPDFNGYFHLPWGRRERVEERWAMCHAETEIGMATNTEVGRTQNTTRDRQTDRKRESERERERERGGERERERGRERERWGVGYVHRSVEFLHTRLENFLESTLIFYPLCKSK